MHEVSIVENILESVLETIKDQKVIKVKTIYISVGALSGISVDALEYSFSYIKKAEKFKSTKLIAKVIPLTIKCKKCGKKNVINNGFALQCPICKSISVAIVCGKELTIDKIEVEYET